MQKETGWSDYGARMYMADIGRWFGMDQLSEAYSSFSPYAYVGNNPVMRTDPDGRKWINNDNVTLDPEYIGVASGGGGGFASYFAGGGSGFSAAINAYFGNTGSGWGTGGSFGGGGGGRGYATFGQTPAYSAAMNWLNNPDSKGDSFSIVSQKGGYLRYWTNMPETGMAGDIQGLDGHMMKLGNNINAFFTNLSNNQYFSAGHLGVSEATSRFGGYALTRTLNPDYINFTVLSDLARPYAGTTVAGIRMSSTTAANLSKYTRYGGYALAGVAVIATELQYADGQIGDTERWANHIMTGVGLIPSPWTIGAALVYGVVTGGYQAVTGRSIFNDMGLGPKK